jgi:hypothetical protein
MDPACRPDVGDITGKQSPRLGPVGTVAVEHLTIIVEKRRWGPTSLFHVQRSLLPVRDRLQDVCPPSLTLESALRTAHAIAKDYGYAVEVGAKSHAAE